LLDYPYGMESYYILRLGKDLRTKLMKLRTQLFEISGKGSFCCLEPCIILGPCDCSSAIDGTLRYEEGQLFLPLDPTILSDIRTALGTEYPISGIHLGTDHVSVPSESFTIRSVSLAVLTVERREDLTLWNVLSERHLDSDREN